MQRQAPIEVQRASGGTRVLFISRVYKPVFKGVGQNGSDVICGTEVRYTGKCEILTPLKTSLKLPISACAEKIDV
jgi:hypothetical protein